MADDNTMLNYLYALSQFIFTPTQSSPLIDKDTEAQTLNKSAQGHADSASAVNAFSYHPALPSVIVTACHQPSPCGFWKESGPC